MSAWKRRRVIGLNITSTARLIHAVASRMRTRNAGRILITGSIVGFLPRFVPGDLQRLQSLPRQPEQQS
jgi:short-subunit dehydrogenase